jgi:hypothetical protein
MKNDHIPATRRNMKYTPRILCLATIILSMPLAAYEYRNIYEKWESPTPGIHNKYSDFLDHMPHNAVAVEVGVQGGGFAALMLERTNPQKLFLIDCWQHQDSHVYDDAEANVPDNEQEKLYQETKRRFAHDSRVVILRQFSKDAVGQFDDESLDWVYIDANHGYEAIKEDLALWWPKVKKGGILSGHDYAVRPSFGVVQAVNEFLIKHSLYFSHLTREEHIYDSWAIRKPLN